MEHNPKLKYENGVVSVSTEDAVQKSKEILTKAYRGETMEHTCEKCKPKVCECPYDCDGRVSVYHYCEHHEVNDKKEHRMDLITALKSGRRFRRVADEQGKQDPTWYAAITMAPNVAMWSDNDVVAEYEIEPEPPKPIVFACEWIRLSPDHTTVSPYVPFLGTAPFEQFIGKRTRVTIEILD